ncbi:MAG TPA: diaminopimelate decarboxylase [Ktedonobacterales bacterium]|nr:diaminopimelate decarboxylase [Ktedonobacterales bacterium]
MSAIGDDMRGSVASGVPNPQLWPDTATVDAGGRLLVADLDLAELAHRYGTPLYVYDEATIRARCWAFRAAFAARWPDTIVAYAGKAYLSLALCRILLAEGLALDAVSLGELRIALAAGFPAQRIHLHGNFKPRAELDAALALGVDRVVVDSLDELDEVEALARAHGMRAAIWLRLCPDVEAQTHAAIQTGHAASKFGLDVASGAAGEAARRATASEWLDLAGLHAHAGSQLLDPAAPAQVTSFLCDFAAHLYARTGAAIREVSPGGGLGVAYAPGDAGLEVERYAQAVADALRAGVERHRLVPPRLVVEPGRAIVARAGVALYTAGPRKVVPGGPTYLAVDGGMGDNPRPALYEARYTAAAPACIRTAKEELEERDERERVTVVGRYCESGDVLAREVMLPRVAPGEILAIPVSGAYHLAMASNYNAVPRPAVVFVREGQARLVRRRETPDDLLRLEQGLEVEEGEKGEESGGDHD